MKIRARMQPYDTSVPLKILEVFHVDLHYQFTGDSGHVLCHGQLEPSLPVAITVLEYELRSRKDLILNQDCRMEQVVAPTYHWRLQFTGG